MADRGESLIVWLVLLAAGSVLGAPVLGSSGYPGAADLAMALAAACGLGSFLLAGRATLRAWRAGARSARAAEDVQ